MSGMRVRFWGVRGSIPCPGPDTVVYGGNTACIEVRCDDRLIVLDAGSGLRELGRVLRGQPEPIAFDLLLTHCHVDHLIGLPFFEPAFSASTAIRFWAGHLSPRERLETVVAQFMIPPLLPITPSTFKADITYRDFLASDTLDLGGGIRVATAALSHPGGATGYRVEYDGKALTYITDNEHWPDEPDPALVDLARGADLLIYDAMFTPDEYRARPGWGHSTWADAVRLADLAGVAQLALFHHDPSHDDATMKTIETLAAQARRGTFAARDHMVVDL